MHADDNSTSRIKVVVAICNNNISPCETYDSDIILNNYLGIYTYFRTHRLSGLDSGRAFLAGSYVSV